VTLCGDLNSQKVLQGDAGIGIYFSKEYLLHHLPGSSQHLKNLKKPPFNFTKAEQVGQLITTLCLKGDKNGPILPSKADKIICKSSPVEGTAAVDKDIVYKNWSPCFPRLTPEGPIVLKMDFETKSKRMLRRGGFNYSKTSNHYLPKWVMEGPLPPSVLVHFAAKANFEIPTPKTPEANTKKSPTKKTPPPIVPMQMDNIINVLQSMLTKRVYAAIESPMDLLAEEFGVSKKELRALINVQRCGDG
jgi:hypothetical protein